MFCIVVSCLQNLSSWKSRRQSQRKSDEEGEDEGRGTKQPQPMGYQLQQQQQQHASTLSSSSQERATQQLSNEIEDMVLSAFGFTRAEQQPTAVVRSTDLVPASRTRIHSLQQPRPAPSDASVS